jgi:hypothetical protein
MKKYSLSALVAAGLAAGAFATTGANAADLGGNCCADLEERVAELEATTARKGNRKVSLTVSGWVGEQVMGWDDGHESNAYVVGLGTTLGTNVKFTGQATIVPGWTAGYVIHIETDGSDALRVDQGGEGFGLPGALDPDASGNGDNGKGVYAGTQNYVQTLQSFWFIKSDHWGKVGVGLQSQASDNTAILVDGSGSLVPANWVMFDVATFNVRNKGNLTPGPLIANFGACGTHGGAAGDCNGLTTNSVRYDTPTFAGFSASASWGEDDFWDMALRYAGEHHGFKFAIAAAYDESTDSNGTGGAGAPVDGDLNYFQIGAYLQHIGTGLFLYGAYGDFEQNGPTAATTGDGESWYIKGGIRGKWHALGATIPYIEYWEAQGDDGVAAVAGVGNSSEMQEWGAGIVQEIDAAAMSVWFKYRNFEFDDNDPTTSFEDFNEYTFGGLINF